MANVPPDYQREWRRAHPENCRAYHKKRAGDSARIEYFRNRREQLGPAFNAKRPDWFAKNPGARKAHKAVENALCSGRLKKPIQCQNCDLPKPLQAHHRDYEKPLEVRWLCRSCHRIAHEDGDL